LVLFDTNREIAPMFLFLTTPGYESTVAAFVRPLPESDAPRCKVTTYDALLRSNHTVRALHVFTDLERLSYNGLVAAAGLYRSLREAGIRCLNDPARVMGRYQLLCKLFDEGINPFAVYRADAQPKPARFPVFVRNESNHDGPMSALLKSQDELEGYFKELVEVGRPLRGLMVVEFAAEPLSSGIWRKTGTYRIGKKYTVNHHDLSDNWVVKVHGGHVTNATLQLEEQADVIANDVPENVHRAFEVGCVEWGRADHTLFRGREIIFEINTAPVPYMTDFGNPIRSETKRIEVRRMFGLMHEIDWGDGKVIRYRPGKAWRRYLEDPRIRGLLMPVWQRVPERQRLLLKRIAL
jgi:hypothetical protein